MSRIEELLKKKSDAIENRKDKTIQIETDRQTSESVKMKQNALDEELKRKELEEEGFKKKDALEEELKRKELEKEKQKEFERISTIKRRKKAVKDAVVKNARSYGFVGLTIGAVIGFGKGCVSYGDNYIGSGGNFSEPFRYILPNALILCIIGVVIGILVGIYKGQNS